VPVQRYAVVIYLCGGDPESGDPLVARERDGAKRACSESRRWERDARRRLSVAVDSLLPGVSLLSADDAGLAQCLGFLVKPLAA